MQTRLSLLTLLLCLLLTPFFLKAESHTGCDAAAIVQGASHILLNEENKSIKFIRLEEPLAIHPAEMDEWLIDVLNTNTKTSFRLYETRPDQSGYIHYRFRQTYDGIDVDNGVYYIHTLGGKIVTANGEFYPDISIPTVPVLSPSAAIELGKAHMHSHHWAWADDEFPMPKLFVASSPDGFHLAYKTDIYSVKPLDRKWLMIDAVSGKVVAEYNRIHSNSVEGEAHCKYHGVQTITVDSIAPGEYRLRDDTRGGGVETYDMNEDTDYGAAVDFTDSDNVWNTTTNQDDAALDAHWSTGGMYDYMLNEHGWESYDGNGTVMLSYVHYASNFFNAFWDGERMTYGDGNGTTATALTSADVVGHEVMHGVTENTAGLIYSDESGGLNESYSDCFGTLLDFELNPTNANYLVGDDFSLTGNAFRNMGNPNEYENPDTYDGLYWDFNEVHNWSGVQNFWFYLVTQGGTGTNDIGNNYTVDAMPMDEVADILFRSLTVYLTPNSTYADARFYGIESATDLFGACTHQVINVANGWHAVGVGDVFSDAVAAGFFADLTYNCQAPATVQFTNTSNNGATYLWDFGNGTTSTDENPTVTYTTAGIYTISLISSGTGFLCENVDTFTLTNYVTIADLGAAVSASCSPMTNLPEENQGIFKFSLESINNLTAGSVDNYQDYSCTYLTEVQEGVLYQFSVRTGDDENIRIWIDVNGDGIFNNTNELVYQSASPLTEHFGQFLIPDTDIYGQTLRLRVKSDDEDSDISDPCMAVATGQVEDYGVIISENTSAPATDFTADFTAVFPGSTVSFTDLTQNIPVSWNWVFEGGIPATSVEQYPSVVYNTLGTYPVTLSTTNAFGASSEAKVDYILVANIATMCTTQAANSPTGLFTDSGGVGGNYSDAEFCEFLIDPGCALEVTLEFTAFDLESGYDYMYIYDGANDAAPLIGVYDGTGSPGSVVGTTGKLFIVFDSDFSVTNSGWEASWASLVATQAPVADFNISNNNTPVNTPVDFTDTSTEFPVSWQWVFGNGDTSMEQNPSYAYDTPGTYTVTLITSNCFDVDTVTQNITVQQFPGIIVDPLSIELTLSCEDSLVVPVTVTNNGSGDLVFDFSDGSGGGANDLASVKERLNTDFSLLTDLMPNFFPISEGEFGFEINDGGNDMYDGGNQLSVDNSGLIEYSNDVIVPDNNMGTNGQYFTLKYPGLFVFAADINQVDLFSIDGDLGADGAGVVNSSQLTAIKNGTTYSGFVKRVFDSGDPSVNHLIIVEDNASLVQTISNNTNTDDHDISGMNGANRVYYLLFAEANSGQYSDAQMGAIMDQFLDIVVGSGSVTLPFGTQVLNGSTNEIFDFIFYNGGLEDGTYNSTVSVNSNDPSFVNLEIDIILHINNAACTDFSFTPLNDCTGAVQFTDISQNTPSSWSWDFGDGSTSEEQNPNHIYQQPGTYEVTLTTVNSFGTSENNISVTVEDVVTADIQPVGDTQALIPITFEAIPNFIGPASYLWDFGDGETATAAMPEHIYTSPGVYTVSLTITNALGCFATTTIEVNILTTGVSELEGSISVYPNPADDAIFIRNTSAERYTEIELVNAIGQVVRQVANNDFTESVYTLNVEGLSAGVYILGIRFGEEGFLRRKVVVE